MYVNFGSYFKFDEKYVGFVYYILGGPTQALTEAHPLK